MTSRLVLEIQYGQWTHRYSVEGEDNSLTETLRLLKGAAHLVSAKIIDPYGDIVSEYHCTQEEKQNWRF